MGSKMGRKLRTSFLDGPSNVPKRCVDVLNGTVFTIYIIYINLIAYMLIANAVPKFLQCIVSLLL